jgi:hypothetical protein
MGAVLLVSIYDKKEQRNFDEEELHNIVNLI